MRILVVMLALLWSLSAAAEVEFGLQVVPFLHASDPKQSSRTDCETELGGLGAYVKWRWLEADGALGQRRERCGANRHVGSGAYLAVKIRPGALRWRR